jgi:hypothetical protein
MKKLGGMFFVLFLALISAAAQDNPSNDEFAPLVLVRIIPTQYVQGHFLERKGPPVVRPLTCAGDADDMYYDGRSRRIYVIGGEGVISVFQQRDPDNYGLRANISSSIGARTGFYFPTHDTDRLTWRSHRMLDKLQNSGFMRYRIERRGRMVSIDFEALANSDETVHR